MKKLLLTVLMSGCVLGNSYATSAPIMPDACTQAFGDSQSYWAGPLSSGTDNFQNGTLLVSAWNGGYSYGLGYYCASQSDPYSCPFMTVGDAFSGSCTNNPDGTATVQFSGKMYGFEDHPPSTVTAAWSPVTQQVTVRFQDIVTHSDAVGDATGTFKKYGY